MVTYRGVLPAHRRSPIQVLTAGPIQLNSDPEHHNVHSSQTDRQTYGQTDDSIMPIDDHTAKTCMSQLRTCPLMSL